MVRCMIQMSGVYGKAKYRDDLKNVVLFYKNSSQRCCWSDMDCYGACTDGYFKQEGHDGPGSLT